MLKNNLIYNHDEHLYFWFGNHHSSDYNLFIVNENDLIIENELEGSTEFTNAMFQEGSYLLGTSRNQKTITRHCATVTTLAKYKEMMLWLTKGSTGFLVFDSNPYWGWDTVLDTVSNAEVVYGSDNMIIATFDLTWKTVGSYAARNRYSSAGIGGNLKIVEANRATIPTWDNMTVDINEQTKQLKVTIRGELTGDQYIPLEDIKNPNIAEYITNISYINSNYYIKIPAGLKPNENGESLILYITPYYVDNTNQSYYANNEYGLPSFICAISNNTYEIQVIGLSNMWQYLDFKGKGTNISSITVDKMDKNWHGGYETVNYSTNTLSIANELAFDYYGQYNLLKANNVLFEQLPYFKSSNQANGIMKIKSGTPILCNTTKIFNDIRDYYNEYNYFIGVKSVCLENLIEWDTAYYNSGNLSSYNCKWIARNMVTDFSQLDSNYIWYLVHTNKITLNFSNSTTEGETTKMQSFAARVTSFNNL